MKKFLAILAAGTMLIGTTANAMVLEQDFFDYTQMNVSVGTKILPSMIASDTNSGTAISHEASIINGEAVFSGTDTSYWGTFKPMISKVFATTGEDGDGNETTVYNKLGTGKTVISFDARWNGSGDLNGDYEGTMIMDVYTGNETDGFQSLFSLHIGHRGWDMYLSPKSGNADRLSGNLDTIIPKSNKMGNVKFEIDHDNDKLTLLNTVGKEGSYASVPYDQPHQFDTGKFANKPVTKIELKWSCNPTKNALIIDNFKVVNNQEETDGDTGETMVTENVLMNETFDADTNKLTITDYGVGDNTSYVYRTENAIGVIRNSSTSDASYVFEKSFDTLPTTGKAVIEYSLNAWDKAGNKMSPSALYWNGCVGNDYPMFAVGNRTANNNYQKVAGYTTINHGGTQEQAERVYFVGIPHTATENNKAPVDAKNTTVAAGTKWKDVSDMKLVLDMDNKTYNVYYKDATDAYQQFNADADIPFTADSGDINKMWFGMYGRSDIYRYEFSNLKIYTIDASGKQTPVVVKDDAEVSTITAGDKVTVYAPFEGDTEYASLIIAAYNEDGKMVDCKIEEAGAEITGFELLKKAYTMPEGAVTMKAFIWDGVGDLTPYAANAVLTAPVAEVPAE